MQFSARYTNGQTSRRMDVMVEIYPRGIIIHHNGIAITKWPYTALYVSQDWKSGIGGTIAYQKTAGAALTFDDRQGFENIRTRLELKHRATYKIPLTLPAILMSLIAAVAVIVIGFPLYGKISENAVVLIPASIERAIGDQVIKSLNDEFAPCDDKAAQEHAERIVKRLVKASGEKDLQVDVHLIRDPMVNAFALPGRHMVLMTGFLQKAENEEEIAGVLAHELGHLVKRDAMRMTLQSQGYNIMLSLITGGGSSYSGMAQLATLANILSYSREKETNADEFAAQILPKAGYSRKGLTSFFKKIMDEHKDDVLGKLDSEFSFLSTHPATNERIARMQFPDNIISQYSLSASDMAILKNACRPQKKAADTLSRDIKTD